MKTKENKKTKIQEKVVDAKEKTLGRVSSEVAVILMGKDKPTFERNKYSGTPVKVTNASKMRMTAKKMESISHTRYSGYPGGLKVMKADFTAKTKGYGELIKLSVYQMLPKNKLRKEMLKNLKIEE